MAKKSVNRCGWAGEDPLYVKYHDEEWGVAVGRPSKSDKSSSEPNRATKSDFSSLYVSSDMSHSGKITFDQHELSPEQELSALKARQDDQKQFEFLILEGAQAGLSWITILRRRDGYRRVFKNFDVQKVAAMTEDEIQIALQDSGIIRNKLKVRAAIKNAQVFIAIQEEFGSFSNYIWQFVDGKVLKNKRNSMSDIPATSSESDALSKDLKQRGMSFVGSTIMYAHMQATGLVNDHTVSCFRYKET